VSLTIEEKASPAKWITCVYFYGLNEGGQRNI